jgi:ankyrin repeat protein
LFFSGNLEVLNVLLKAKADPNAVDDEGSTPLHQAVASGHIDCVKALIQVRFLKLQSSVSLI